MGNFRDEASQPGLRRITVGEALALRGPRLGKPISRLMLGGSISLLRSEDPEYLAAMVTKMAAHIATGRDFAGLPVRRARPVLHLAGANHIDTEDNVTAWAEANGTMASAYYKIGDHSFSLDDAGFEAIDDFLWATLDDDTGNAVVFLHQVGGLETGRKTHALVGKLRALITKYNCSFVIAYVSPKRECSGDWDRLEGCADALYELVADPAAMTCTLRVEKQRNAARLDHLLPFRGTRALVGKQFRDILTLSGAPMN